MIIFFLALFGLGVVLATAYALLSVYKVHCRLRKYQRKHQLFNHPKPW